MANKLINCFGNIGRVIGADYYELKGVIPEINDAAIAKIFCIRETLRALKGEFKKERILDSIHKIIKYLRVAIGQSRKEHLRVLYLDQSYYLIHEYIEDCGNIDSSPLYIREIVINGLAVGATELIIAHNHPNGIVEPSKADQQNTLKLASVCDGVGIKLIDHIIVTSKDYFSFDKNRLL